MKRAFTLMEVNLAIMIMAGGILSILGLYSLGYRENSQSREDVAATAYADAVISPLVWALSSTNLSWSAFNGLKSHYPDKGWGSYVNSSTGLVDKDPDSIADNQVFSKVMSDLGVSEVRVKKLPKTEASAGMKCGLVVLHDKNSAVVRIAFRAARHSAELLAMPIFYTEVRFQGVPNK